MHPCVRWTRTTARLDGLSTRAVWSILLGWTGLWAVVAGRGGGYSWHYFAQGATLLTHPNGPGAGLHLYAAHPDLQIGPLALLASVPINALGAATGRFAAEVLLTLLGLLILQILVVVRRRTLGARPAPSLLLLTGLLVLPVWTEVGAHFAHLDDALALFFTAAAAWAVTTRRAVLAPLLLAAAVNSKPWALGFAVLLLVLPPWERRRSAVVLGAAVAAAWLPFVLADPATLALGRFTIENVDTSALNALGVHSAGTPAWDRPAQLVLGAAVGLVCVRRGRWFAVPLAVVVARLLLDPQTYPYYSSGLLVAAALVDLMARGRRFPVWTAAAASWYVLDALVTATLAPWYAGILRAAYCLGVLIVLSTLPAARGRGIPARTRPARPARYVEPTQELHPASPPRYAAAGSR